jgi:hypothetical protein
MKWHIVRSDLTQWHVTARDACTIRVRWLTVRRFAPIMQCAWRAQTHHIHTYILRKRPVRIPLRNDAHSVVDARRIGPSACFESRTSTSCAAPATSTQAPESQNELFFHARWEVVLIKASP